MVFQKFGFNRKVEWFPAREDDLPMQWENQVGDAEH